MKITFNGPEKPAERKIVGWRSKKHNDNVYLLREPSGYFFFKLGKRTSSQIPFASYSSGDVFNDRDYDPIYEGEFSITITA